MSNILDRLLISLAVRLQAFAVCEIKTGWRLLFDPMEALVIHYVLAGKGTAAIGSRPPIPFKPHSIIVVPVGEAQSLGAESDVVGRSQAAENCLLLADGLVKFTAGDGSRDILTVCGTISATYSGAIGLFDGLRAPLLADAETNGMLRHAFGFLFEEMANPGLGTQVLTESIMRQCLIILLREQLMREGVRSPLFLALEDSRLARALAEVLQAPAKPWTVERLAGVAGMSRSSFAEHFAAAFGHSPMEFVQKVRMRHAGHLLATTELPVKVIATSIGYASRSYFSRAFSAAYGIDPTAFRHASKSSKAEDLQLGASIGTSNH